MSGTKKTVIALIAVIIGIAAIAAGIAFGAAGHFLGKMERLDDSKIDKIAPEDEFFETDVPYTPPAPKKPAAENAEPVETDLAVTEAPETMPEGANVIEPEDVVWSDPHDPGVDTSMLINLMLVGQDRREGQMRQRSDTMILVSINPQTKQIAMISFLRDLYVRIPGGYSDNRLNVAYAFGGFPLLSEAMYVNFGVRIDGFFEVDFERFVDVIDAVGGVDITLTEAEVKYVSDTVVGLNHLDGKQALSYARIRKTDSDFGRSARQRNLLTSVLNKARKMNLTELYSLANAVFPALATDMSNTQIVSLMSKCLPMISSCELKSYRVPENDAYQPAWVRGMAVLLPDLDKARYSIFNEYLPLG